MDPAVLAALPQSEVNRQTIIHKLISYEVQYHVVPCIARAPTQTTTHTHARTHAEDRLNGVNAPHAYQRTSSFALSNSSSSTGSFVSLIILRKSVGNYPNTGLSMSQVLD
jgi:hypothetical protein